MTKNRKGTPPEPTVNKTKAPDQLNIKQSIIKVIHRSSNKISSPIFTTSQTNPTISKPREQLHQTHQVFD